MVTSPDELYLVYPGGTFPWDEQQIKTLAEQRSNLTVGLLANEVAAFAKLYKVLLGQSAFIGNVIVSDRHKGQGIGKAITNHMINVCRNQYQAVAHLSVFNYNTRALLLYASLGFKPYAVEARKNLQDNTVAVIHMHYE